MTFAYEFSPEVQRIIDSFGEALEESPAVTVDFKADRWRTQLRDPDTGEWVDSPEYSEAESEAINGYVAAGGNINGRPREPDVRGYKFETHTVVVGMDSSIAKGKLEKDSTFYRGFGEGAFGLTKDQLLAGQVEHLIGSSWSDKGFMSVTSDPKVAAKISNIQNRKKAGTPTVFLELHARKGQSALDVVSVGLKDKTNAKQKETVLPRNSKLTLTGFRSDEEGNIILEGSVDE